MRTVQIGGQKLGGGQGLGLIAGPCVIENERLCLEVAAELGRLASGLEMPFVFKSSFDKANRSSLDSFRGPGLEEGLRVLGEVKRHVGCPVLTDVHEPWQAEVAARTVDALQIPAFLCRQTDLLLAAGRTGLPVLIKKGQFVSPWEMAHPAGKVESTGNRQVLLVERGASFGYQNLVVDFRSLAVMRSLGYPVVFDATHSVQLPGAAGSQSGGQREFVPALARAAAGVGMDALFLEVHPCPSEGLSDSAAMLPLDQVEPLLRQVKAIDRLVKESTWANL